MKISVITTTLNSDQTIRDTLNSILSQTYKNIEHIIVDGGSSDNTASIIKRYPNNNKKFYTKKNSGIYEAINYGITKATGDFITILNSDDFYQSQNTISSIVKKIKKNKKILIFLGDVVYFKKLNYKDISRVYRVGNFKPWHMKFGLMPPHPGSFIKSEVYKKNKLYIENFKIASDYEFFLRILYIKKIKFKNLNEIIVRMRLGGISTRNIFSYITSTKEIYSSLKRNNIMTNLASVILRLPLKISQLFNFNQKKINNKFKLFKVHFDHDQNFVNNFNLIDDFKRIPYRTNFILSAMNLAFLGYYAAGKVYPYKNLYHWVDGLWAEKYTQLRKKPGRDLVRDIKIPDSIKNIMVIGNLTNKTKKYLLKKFNKPILNTVLPYASINEMKKIKINIPNNALTFITLPTPKQEQLAFHLSKKKKKFKIICIGASLAIASGEERRVPNFLKKYEFIWRLRTDTIRRIIRLVESLYYYTKGKWFLNKYAKTSFKIID